MCVTCDFMTICGGMMTVAMLMMGCQFVIFTNTFADTFVCRGTKAAQRTKDVCFGCLCAAIVWEFKNKKG